MRWPSWCRAACCARRVRPLAPPPKWPRLDKSTATSDMVRRRQTMQQVSECCLNSVSAGVCPSVQRDHIHHTHRLQHEAPNSQLVPWRTSQVRWPPWAVSCTPRAQPQPQHAQPRRPPARQMRPHRPRTGAARLTIQWREAVRIQLAAASASASATSVGVQANTFALSASPTLAARCLPRTCSDCHHRVAT